MVFGVCFVILVVLVVLWILAQADNFDPADRDISMAALEKGSVADTLYESPLKRWVEPGSAAGETPRVELGIFPQSVLDGGWQIDGRVETYDPDNLYMKINGAAEQYLAFGFERLHYLTIAKGGDLLMIEIYDQSEFRNTLGLFAAQRASSRQVTTSGSLFYYSTPIGAVGGFENYYFKIAGNSDSEAILDKTANLVGVLASLPVDARSAPRPYTLLVNQLEFDFDRVSYEKNDAFQYEFADDFWFAATNDEADWRLFVHEAGNDGQARDLIEQIIDEQQVEYSVLNLIADGADFEHQYLKTVFSIRRSGSFVFGVDGAPNLATAQGWLSRLKEGISHVE